MAGPMVGPLLDAVGMPEINKIFAVLDEMGVHREHVVIPLGTGKGRVRRMPSVWINRDVDAPIAFGLLRRHIVVPAPLCDNAAVSTIVIPFSFSSHSRLLEPER